MGARQQFMHSYSAFVQDYFGFAMVPLGRAVAYALAALHCMGARATTDHAALYRFVWYSGCLLMIGGVVASVFAWRKQRRSVPLLDAEGVDSRTHQQYACEYYEPPVTA